MLQTNLDCPFMNNACFVFRLVVLEVHPLSYFLNSLYIKHHRTIPYDMMVRLFHFKFSSARFTAEYRGAYPH